MPEMAPMSGPDRGRLRAVGARDRGRVHVVIAGGGIAAVETLLALRALAGRRIQVTLLSRERELLYRPVTVTEAFDRGEARAYDLAEIVGNRGGDRVVWDSLSKVDADAHSVITEGGEEIPYDRLVVATGALFRDSLPGALTFRGRADVPALRAVLDDLVQARAASVALVVPSETIWTLPIYELALMTASHLREHGAGGSKVVLVVTPEEEPLELFGPAATEAISSLLIARGISLRTSSLPALMRGRALVLAGGGEIYVDRVIALALLEGPGLAGLPHDKRGFIPVDTHGQVSGVDDVYAAGDITTFPLKQGGLATQQADAVAAMIAAEIGIPITPEPFRPVLRGLLMTGGAPLYLRAEPQRLPRGATVAIEAKRSHGLSTSASAATGQALWWPPVKVAGRYLGPYLATARPQPLTSGLLADRVTVPGPPLSEAEYQDALELALLLADCDARWGDHRSALAALEAAEALEGTLPPEYEAKRREWRAAERLEQYTRG
jgi:sulfide:quinone oxidoreductase